MGRGASEDLKSCITSINISRLPDYELRKMPMNELVEVLNGQKEHYKKIECENEILERYISMMGIEMNAETSTELAVMRKPKRFNKHILSALDKIKVYAAVIEDENKKIQEKMKSLILNTENFQISETQLREELSDAKRKLEDFKNAFKNIDRPGSKLRGEEILTHINKSGKRQARFLLKNLIQNKILRNEYEELRQELISKTMENDFSQIDVERFSIEYSQLISKFNAKNQELQKIKQKSSRTVPMMTDKKDELRKIKLKYESKLVQLQEMEQLENRLKETLLEEEEKNEKAVDQNDPTIDYSSLPTRRDLMAGQIVHRLINSDNKKLENKIYLSKIHWAKVRHNRKVYSRV